MLLKRAEEEPTLKLRLFADRSPTTAKKITQL